MTRNQALDAAARVIVECADELTALLAGRGYLNLDAEIWCRRGVFTCFINGKNREVVPYIGSRLTLSELMYHARQKIAETIDANAAAPWFEWQQADAAE